jgi:hypothetical protein
MPKVRTLVSEPQVNDTSERRVGEKIMLKSALMMRKLYTMRAVGRKKERRLYRMGRANARSLD